MTAPPQTVTLTIDDVQITVARGTGLVESALAAGIEIPVFCYEPRLGPPRMGFPKRTFEKPIPISPTIALDRERCILCYRCTRFSESVAEDGQLVAINRGAQSVIATFDGDPYRGVFSGNVLELCPVGA